MRQRRSIRLFWRVFLLDAALFTGVALVLLVTPVTISAPIAPIEAVSVIAALFGILTIDALVLRSAIQPLERLAARMETVDLLHPSGRLQLDAGDEIERLVRAFNTMLERLEAERRESGRRLLEAQEQERLSIARDLHDEVGQLLTGVLLELDATRGDDRPVDLTPAVSSVRRALDEVRRISRSLRPQMLEELGLASALTELCTSFERTSGVRVVMRFDPSIPSFDGDVELALYRIAQESLTNVARHASATSVVVALQASTTSIVLNVVDDGIGIDQDAEQSGGLRGMRERALLIGAALAVRPAAASGTDVRLEVPLDATMSEDSA
jgi:two-component system sensor histidine kinase UhpB